MLEGHGPCIQSRHAGLDPISLARAVRSGVVRSLSGASLVESTDGTVLMHLGHPEYTPARLLFEYERDRERGRANVEAPHGVGHYPAATPLPHGYSFFARWLHSIRAKRADAASLARHQSA